MSRSIHACLSACAADRATTFNDSPPPPVGGEGVREPTRRANRSDAPARKVSMSTRIVDLFAGAGGWEEGLRLLGSYDSVGIESDPVACRTAEAAGHRRLAADIATAEPSGFGGLWGLIGSPPCQAYSLAGKGLGRVDQEHVVACARDLAAGRDTRAEHTHRCRDSRSLLTVEPLRWALALRPAWIALEQVPPVLGLWSLFAELLEGQGYRCAVGVLSAERYGVAQTRRRAFLIASRRGSVSLPAPSHRSFNFRRPEQLLDEEAGLAGWVSMAEALGWDDDRGMSYTNCQTNGGRRPRGLTRPVAWPARTIDTSVGAWSIERHDRCERRHHRQRPSETGHDGRHHGAGGARSRLSPVVGEAHAQEALAPARVWSRRPSSRTVLGESLRRTARREASGVRCADRCCVGNEEVRLSVAQTGVLQGFRADYPWHGSRSRQLRQVGNAVCPPLAARVLAEAMRPSLPGGGAS
jgi:DNA (cytosine-5)-methyltransferase 1